ncbi:transposable element Tcb1 transposase [Trichonephila clavipes]|nr:transposable element Tcb1 transposase [Trichonephila clavipes]
MISLLKKFPRLTAAQIVTDVHEKLNKIICADTARKILKKVGYRSRLARRKLYISMTNQLKRIAFENEHINKPPEFCRSIIFTGESKLCIFSIKGRKLAWNKLCTELQKEHLVSTVKHGGGGVMVWGCMTSNGVGKLKYIESIMNKYDYLDVLKKLSESATKLGLGSSVWFQLESDLSIPLRL